ncbi:MAG: hypothetical protein J6C86_05010 [Bacteroidaceae bacterium]|nr:hypothetical protein [Bacteroidaceae bacterium]
MNKLALSALSGALLLVTSCTTINKTATTADISNNIKSYPEVVDLDVQAKTALSMTWTFKPFHIGEPKLSTAKGNLIAEALSATKADVLLEPQFIYTKTSYGERVLSVTGYPATYKNFRKATPEDIEAIKACNNANEKIHHNSGGNGLFGIFSK